MWLYTVALPGYTVGCTKILQDCNARGLLFRSIVLWEEGGHMV